MKIRRLPLVLCISFAINKTASLSLSQSQSQSLTLDFDNDRFDGVYIKNLPCCKTKFNSLLDESLKVWRDNHRKAAWLKIPVDKIDLTSVAISKGFQLHSCEKDYLMLTKWLADSPSTIPNQPHNQLGIGVICYDKKNKRLLTVKERNGAISHIFKIPTGAVDPKEDISSAAVRELHEETGIRGKFIGIVGFRHAHGFLNDKSDMFFLCLVEPLSFEITMQEEELVACEWLELDSYFNQEWFKGKILNEMMNDEIKKTIKAIESNKLINEKHIMKEHILENGWRPGTSVFYSIK